MLPINNGHRGGIYPRERGGGVRRTLYRFRGHSGGYQLGNLFKVLSEFHNAVKVCRLNDGV